MSWSPALSSSLYRIDQWGEPYFSVNSSGNVIVRPFGTKTLPHQEIDLLEVVKQASGRKSLSGYEFSLPLIVRFPDVLKDRLDSLQSAFDFAIESQCYESHYQGVYPVKCNQDRVVVEDIVKFGSSYRYGLSVGSKPELLLAMSCLCKGSPEGLLFCNGFKDTEYISLALIGRKLLLNTVIVVEQEEELDLVINISTKMSVRPVIGLPAKLRTEYLGHFGTLGENEKFGLTTTQILRVVKKLEKFGMLDCLELLHFRMGSQIPSTNHIASGVREATQIYTELIRLGANVKIIDIGGGLGIDYDGSRSKESDDSVGYDLDEYTSAVVQAVRVVCDLKGIKHPIICSQSGRAIVAHHSVLVFEAVSASTHDPDSPFKTSFAREEEFPEEARTDYAMLTAAAKHKDYEKYLFYANRLKQSCVEMFKEGVLNIEQLAAADELCDFLEMKAFGPLNPIRKYHVNLSVFTSLPDFWGIQQVYPIVPIHRLDEEPVVKGILLDLTGDSHGKIDKFIGGKSSLPLHEMTGEGGVSDDGGGYYLGMFLGGAYEEAVVSLHNLYSGPSVVRVLSQSDKPQNFVVTRAIPGPSSSDVLQVMQYDPWFMFLTLKGRAEEYILQDQDLMNGLAQSFKNMPYLTTASSCWVTKKK